MDIQPQKERKALRITLSVIVSFFLFISCICTISVLSLRATLSGGTITDILKSTGLLGTTTSESGNDSQTANDISLNSDALDGLNLDEVDDVRDIKGLDAESADKIIAALTSGDLDALSEAICEAIEKNPDALAELGGSVKKEQIAKTIEKSTLPAYLEKRATEYAEYIAGGAEPQPITSDEIHGLLEENIVVVEQEFNVTISKADREELKKVVDEQAETIEKITDMSKVSETEYGDVIKLLRGFASPVTMWVLIIVDVVLLALLVIINRKAFPALLCGGISLTLSGLVFTIISFCSGLISGIVADSANLSASLINTVMSKVCGLIRMYGLPVLIVGFLMIIAALIVKIVTASKSPAPVPASAPDVFVPVAEEPVPEYAAQTVSETVSQPTHETLTPITEVISEPSETVTDSAAQTAETEKTE